MGIRDKWRQLKATAKGLFHKPAMIGTPPSARPMWHDPAAHAIDFSKRYAEPLDQYVTVRMEDLGIPKDRIGSSDHDHGIDWCAFNPYEDTGGGVGTEGQINVDSGIFNSSEASARGIHATSVAVEECRNSDFSPLS